MRRIVKSRSFGQRPLGRPLLFLAVLLLTLLFGTTLSNHSAHAASLLTPDPGSNISPAAIASIDGCVSAYGVSGGNVYNPGIASWISPAGKPGQTSMTVPYGTTTINLDFNTALAVCVSLPVYATEVGTEVWYGSPGTSGLGYGLGGPQIFLPIAQPRLRGFYTSNTASPLHFTYTKPGGFTTSGTTTIDAYQTNIQHYSNDAWVCNSHGAVVHPVGWDFGVCYLWDVKYDIYVNVTPKKVTVTDATPTASLSVSCNTATPVFNDADGSTTATLYKNGVVFKNLTQADSGNAIDVSSYTGATSVTFKLTVNDNLPSGYTGSSTPVTISKTVGACVTDTSPTAALTPDCTALTLTPTFSDKDGNTTASLYKNGALYKSLIQSDSKKAIDVSSFIGFSAVTFDLTVNDVLPGGGGGGAGTQVTKTVTMGPCGGNLTCNGANTSPSTPEPGQSFTIVAGYKYSGGTPPNPSNQSLTVQLPGNPPQTYNGSQLDYNITSSNTFTLSLHTPISLPAAGTYNVSWSVTVGALPAKNCAGSQTTVGFKPYLQAYNGDVVVGGGVPTIATTGKAGCTAGTTNTNAGIDSWNTEIGGGYTGAGSQYGARALNDIFDFASSFTVTGGSGAGRPVALSFSNAGTNNNGKFGTDFGSAPVACDTQLVEGAADPGAAVVNGPISLDNALTTAGISPSTGTHTLYIKGDLYIGSDVKYTTDGTGGYGSVGGIPSFRLIVLGGDISIDAGVDQLDGSYNAIPSTTGGGSIYTCTTNGYGSGSAINDANNFSSCRQQLVVNGTLTAKQIWFLRSCGTLNLSVTNPETVGPVYSAGSDVQTCSATNHAAEVINDAPETWLAPGTGTGSSSSYDAIQNLPPVL